MSPEIRSGPIVHISTSHTESLQGRLCEASSAGVRSITPAALEDDLESVFDGENEFDGESESDAEPSVPAGIVLELERPERVRTALERLFEAWPDAPTVVAPPTGSEALAAAALRGGAAEYVPLDGDGDPVERIVDAIRTLGGAVSAGETAGEPTSATAANGAGRAVGVSAAPVESRPATESTGEYHRILANELPDEAFVIAADGTYLEAKVRSDAADLYTTTADELPGKNLAEVFPDDRAAELQACVDRTLRTGDVQSIEYEARTTDGCRRYEGRVVPIDEPIDGRNAVVWLARDITERMRRERELRSRRDELETLNRISAVVGQVIDTLVEAPSREAIEREVCDQLVESELYCGAWIAERTGEGSLAFRTGAGDVDAYLDRAKELEEGHAYLVQQAAETGEIQTATRIPTSDSMPESLCRAARTDGVRSAIAVPISHNDSVYGVLTVLADREDAFGEGERAGFGLLGETIGFTIMAVKNRQLLFADTVVELEFRIDGGNTFSFDLSERYGCTVSLEWAGTTADGRTVQYVTIDGLDGETVLEEAEAHPSIENCRLIHDGGENCTIEIRLAKSGVRTLANHGATFREVTVDDGVGTCLIEVSQDANVREIAKALTVIYENTELVARREIDRPVRTAAQRRDRIFDQLTDRQLTTLRLAYYSGFFEWPRESTGEEIAEAMNVSPPTMHQHLRKGMKAVLEEFFEASGGPQPP
ncbi:helix-turn-helix domain-containing protein [Haloterrigena sp. SYSU A121-1]|uniref:Helix-turn-helix domain-containing protein n=1 Tax=Haloterrigena gelatinilytica TaxID=2741724 RepID=A0A8J8GRB4_9EURY|nr:bacterio-opsin activator domain-containing protein [Haloterrigena gelatinilytica]NUB93918.1 helix-turn-helix domain-containing protein [Haloterrigena gelatinilytica]